MKAILVIDVPDDFETKTAIAIVDVKNEKGEGITAMRPLEHPLKYASNDFYIYDTKYLMENLDREINLLKGTKAFKEFMEKQNEWDF